MFILCNTWGCISWVDWVTCSHEVEVKRGSFLLTTPGCPHTFFITVLYMRKNGNLMCSLLLSFAQVTLMWSWSALYSGFSLMQPAFTILVPTGESALGHLSLFYEMSNFSQRRNYFTFGDTLSYLFALPGLYETIVSFTSTPTLCCLERNLQNGQYIFFCS